MTLSDVLKPFIESAAFTRLISTANEHGISVEQLLGLSVGFLMLLMYLLYTLSSPTKLIALSTDSFHSFELVEIIKVSPDTKRLKFALQSPEHRLGLPIGQHITFRIKNADGKEVTRSYTPISSDDDLGMVEFLIKVYFPNVHPAFPAGGAMTMHLENMKVGDRMDMQGPKGHLDYKGCGAYTITSYNVSTRRKDVKSFRNSKFGFLAGGSGLTPCLQVIRSMLKIPGDTSEIWLLFANKTEDDILLRKELDALAVKHKDRFHLHYTLDSPPKRGWKGSTGFVTEAMCKHALPEASESSFVFMCGPEPMSRSAKGALEKLGYDKDKWFVF
jgi:cytochrome-b5 reductase